MSGTTKSLGAGGAWPLRSDRMWLFQNIDNRLDQELDRFCRQKLLSHVFTPFVVGPGGTGLVSSAHEGPLRDKRRGQGRREEWLRLQV